jgi:uncharacterized protein (DUF1501 family)
MTDKMVHTRRDFLRTAAIATAGFTLPQFLSQAVMAQLEDDPEARSIPGFKDDRVLVVLQLGGGNDGLNTIVPFGDDAYHRERPSLKLPGDQLIKVDDYLALNPALKELQGLLDAGQLAVINGVGYPNPNRSHFRSMEIWHTAVDSDRVSDTGWVGRYFDNACTGSADPVAGINVGSQIPQAFDGEKGVGISFQNPTHFQYRSGTAGDSDSRFRQLNGVGEMRSESESTIDYLRHTTANVALSSDKVIAASRKTRNSAKYPNTPLGRDLKQVADLIAADLPTRIYYVSYTGFDTHANQPNQHSRLLATFSQAVAAFQRDLNRSGLSGRVTTMCFSEFGRRVKENASRGTDHGTAGPMFVIGDHVKAGMHGKYPSLTDLDKGDLKHGIDFRQVYATVLQKWFDLAPDKVLGRNFDALPIL